MTLPPGDDLQGAVHRQLHNHLTTVNKPDQLRAPMSMNLLQMSRTLTGCACGLHSKRTFFLSYSKPLTRPPALRRLSAAAAALVIYENIVMTSELNTYLFHVCFQLPTRGTYLSSNRNTFSESHTYRVAAVQKRETQISPRRCRRFEN